MWTRPILSKPDGGYPYIKDFITPQLRCRANFKMRLLQQETSAAYAALKNATFAVVQAHYGGSMDKVDLTFSPVMVH